MKHRRYLHSLLTAAGPALAGDLLGRPRGAALTRRLDDAAAIAGRVAAGQLGQLADYAGLVLTGLIGLALVLATEVLRKLA